MKLLTTLNACWMAGGAAAGLGAVATQSEPPRTNVNVIESGAQTGSRYVPSASLVGSVPSGRSSNTPVSLPSNTSPAPDHDISWPSGRLLTALPVMSAIVPPKTTREPSGDQPWKLFAQPPEHS